MDYLRRALGRTSLKHKVRAAACAFDGCRLTPASHAPAQVVLLTGAGGGIGGTIALALAEEGCHLCLSDHDPGLLARTQAAVLKVAGVGRVLAVVAELCRPAEITALAEQCTATFGRCDFLLNVGAAPLTAASRCAAHGSSAHMHV